MPEADRAARLLLSQGLVEPAVRVYVRGTGHRGRSGGLEQNLAKFGANPPHPAHFFGVSS